MNARFWVYINGPIKITLKPGQTLQWATGGPCDEGYHYRGDKWFFDGDTVFSEWWSEGRDCDGRIQQWGCASCDLAHLQERKPPYADDDPALWRGVLYPEWTKGDRGQRDEYAEMAGY
jgi:hypothetical protein